MTFDFYNNIIILDNILCYADVQHIFSDNLFIIIILYNVNII